MQLYHMQPLCQMSEQQYLIYHKMTYIEKFNTKKFCHVTFWGLETNNSQIAIPTLSSSSGPNLLLYLHSAIQFDLPKAFNFSWIHHLCQDLQNAATYTINVTTLAIVIARNATRISNHVLAMFAFSMDSPKTSRNQR